MTPKIIFNSAHKLKNLQHPVSLLPSYKAIMCCVIVFLRYKKASMSKCDNFIVSKPTVMMHIIFHQKVTSFSATLI